jgi:hypothetical protein
MTWDAIIVLGIIADALWKRRDSKESFICVDVRRSIKTPECDSYYYRLDLKCYHHSENPHRDA